MQNIIAAQGRIKTRNAYILIYERKQMIDTVRFNEFTEDSQIAVAKQDTAYI